MTSLSTNLGLTLYNATTDQSGSFINWQLNVSGSSNSNMTKIDQFAGFASGSIATMVSNFSSASTIITGSMTNINAALTTLSANIALLNVRLHKIDEFSGTGTATFSDISQDHKHLVIMGTVGAASNPWGYDNTMVAADFNLDANSSNYSSGAWQRAYSPSFEAASSYLVGCIVLGNTPEYSMSAIGYGSSFFAIIPNYSVTGGFYKNAMGFASHSAGVTGTGGTYGGTWLSTDPITSIRMFTTSGGVSTRFSFSTGTLLSLYGFG